MIIDVSIHNGVIDWNKVKESGVTGAIIRCGYGRDFPKYDDARFNENIEGALKVGLKVGVYLYSYAKTIEAAMSEAKHVLRLVNAYKENVTLPIYYDLEEAGTEATAKQRAEVFGDIIEAAGFWCGVYASESWWNTYLKGLNRFTKWVAKWGKNDGVPHNKPEINGTDMWQYTSKGKIAGIRGYVDLDEQLRANIGGYIGKTSKPTPTTPPETPAPTPAPTPETPAPPSYEIKPSFINYTIKKGDTLSKIAKEYNTTVKAIKEANPDKIKNVNKIYAGDRIKIPSVTVIEEE